MTQTTQTRDKIIKMLKDRGCRMTKQRRILLDIILEDNCSSCKEIYYRASKKDKSIGTATVQTPFLIKIIGYHTRITLKSVYHKENKNATIFFCRLFLLTYAFLCGYNRLCMSKIVYEARGNF